MTNKLSYIPGRTCIKVVLEKSAFSTLLTFYFISFEVGRRTQPSSIHLNSQPYHNDTRWFDSFENEALENEDRSTKHPILENEDP